MTISRGQMPRQLYGLGSLVKSVTKAAKKIVKSPIGKAAALYFAPMAFGQSAGLAGYKGLFGAGSFSPFKAMLDAGTADAGFGPSKLGRFLGSKFVDQSTGSLTGISKVLGLTIPSVLAAAGVQEEQIADLQQNKPELIAALQRGYKNLNPDASEEEISEFVRTYSAEGGRIGYANGSEDYEDKFMKLVAELREAGFSQQEAIEEARERLSENKAMGGRIGYAMGDSAEQNAIQASGIMGLPLNENPAGITELDLRETGGFIPPVGVKEKADDIPAMLSNNEFVFTADAVRGMGGGDVDKGAERMYAMMKTLENGGRV